jgi:hypothetical protein
MKRRTKMTNISILKIESETGTLLVSSDATQEITPTSKHEICRNIDLKPIDVKRPSKLRCVVETKDMPDLSILRLGGIFKIYSIIKCRQNDVSKQIDSYVTDSREIYDDHIVYRPVFNALLTNFSCHSHSLGKPLWKLEFEEP